MPDMRGPYRKRSAEERLWRRVEKSDDCWTWQGATIRGYGALMVDHRTTYAHRLSWELANGPIPPGLLVLHHCDNPPCVRPDHLFVGTQLDNIRDAAAKGRTSSGEGRSNRKVSADDVRLMRRLHEDGLNSIQLAKLFPIGSRTIRKILTGKNWRHV